jgi:hypothetical protein
VNRLQFLNNVGLDYLSLDRSADTLSGGESQRIRLASQIGSGLTGVMYVLDEPSIGLHQRDNSRLLATLRHLRDLGNSVLVVEHDEEAITTADYVIDMGPGAGEHGGSIVTQGLPAEILADATSLTGQYLSGARSIAVPPARNKPDPKRMLKIVGATGNNLKSVSLDLPVGLFVCVTGCLRLGQVDADQRHAVSRGRSPPVWIERRAGAARGDPRPRAFRQGDQRRPVADRTDAAVESGDVHRPLHADPRDLRAGEGSARTRLRPGDASRSTSRAAVARPARAMA